MSRVIGNFLMVRGWRRWKIAKKTKHWLKRPKTVHQKTKFGSKYKWFRTSYLKFVFSKIFFRAYNFSTFVYMFQWTSLELHLSKKCQSQQKLPKKIIHFTIQFRLKNLTSFASINSHWKQYGLATQPKPFWVY